jgi:hypothetical protein
LQVLVVNEPVLVEALNRLRGEWAERSGGELTASGTTWKELNGTKTLDADVVVFPSRYLGEVCTRNWLRPVRTSVLESEALKSTDIFPLVRNELIKWGGQAMALPLGLDPQAISLATAATPDAISLLLLAAPTAVSNERLGVLFDADTMKPRIAKSPFVDALTQLNADQAGAEKRAAAVDKSHLPILGHNDRLIAVTTSSRNAASAFNLIGWLAQQDTSTQFARLDRGVLPVRVSLASAAAWYDPTLAASQRSELSKTLVAQLSGEKCLIVPRIPGIDEYLAALDDAVNAAVVDKVPAADALQKASAKWEQITDTRGRDTQREAYQKHLGISDK